MNLTGQMFKVLSSLTRKENINDVTIIMNMFFSTPTSGENALVDFIFL